MATTMSRKATSQQTAPRKWRHKVQQQCDQSSKAAESLWKIVTLLTGVLAAKQARKLLDKVWAKAVGGDPPTNPASQVTTWREALVWAAVSGIVVQTARMVAQRGAAAGWKRATGALPPGLEEGASR